MNEWPATQTTERRPLLLRMPPPELVKRKPIAQAIERYDAALIEKRKAEADLDELVLFGREKAREADVAANAQAIREEKPAPGAEHYAEHMEAEGSQRLQVEAHARVADDAFAELESLVEDNREPWLEEITTAIGKVRDDVVAKANALDQSLDDLDALRGLLGFATKFPEGKGFTIWKQHVEGLAPPDFPPTSRDRVIAALRELGAPEPPMSEPAGAPLSEQQWPSTGAAIGS